MSNPHLPPLTNLKGTNPSVATLQLCPNIPTFLLNLQRKDITQIRKPGDRHSPHLSRRWDPVPALTISIHTPALTLSEQIRRRNSIQMLKVLTLIRGLTVYRNLPRMKHHQVFSRTSMKLELPSHKRHVFLFWLHHVNQARSSAQRLRSSFSEAQALFSKLRATKRT